MKRWSVFSWCGLLLSQASFAKPPVEPAFRMSTRLVEVDVIARDRSDEAVEDLARESFSLSVDGKPRELSFFSRLSDRSEAPPSGLPPNTFSNRASVRSGASSLNIFLIDALNTRFEHRAYTEQELARYMRESARADQPVLVLVSDSTLRVVRDFRGDPASRPGAAAGSHGLASFGAMLAGDIGAAFDVEALSKAEAQWDLLARANQTVDAVESIALNCRGIPGRKNLIWISGMFLSPFNITGPVRERAERVWQAFAEENIAIYPVNACGVYTDARYDPANGHIRPDATSDSPGCASINPDLARRSGGRIFQNTNNLAGAVQRAVQDSSTLYVLGFYADPSKGRGRSHSIHVSVNRPGVRLQYRPFYGDREEKDERRNDPKEQEALMLAAIGSPADANGLPVAARIERGPDPSNLVVIMKTVLDANPQDAVAKYRVLFVQRDREGRQFPGTEDDLETDLSEATFQRLARDGVVLQRPVHRDPRATELRIVVKRDNSGTIGTLTIPFEKLKLD